MKKSSRRSFLQKSAAVGGSLLLVGTDLPFAKAEEPKTENKKTNPQQSEKKNMTLIVTHKDCIKHKTGEGHPERPARLETIQRALASKKAPKGLKFEDARSATVEEVQRVHVKKHIEKVQFTSAKGGYMDRDTPVMEESYRAALLSAGGAMQAVDAVLDGKAKNAFVAVRPPGHHSYQDRAMGFCLFNNIAVAARHAQQRKDIERVLIVDWDLHHGNGTQNIFYKDGTVQFFSSHAYPFYPGTGKEKEIGEGKGKGLIINAPLEVGSGDDAVIKAFETKLLPAAEKFKPHLVLISCGFDAHKIDPMRGLNFTTEVFTKLGKMLFKIADDHCGGKIVSVLEGGYSLEALEQCTLAHVKDLTEAAKT